MRSEIYIVAAKRSAVVPRGGAFSHLLPHQLAAPIVRTLLQETALEVGQIDHIFLGNGLAGGGNVARMVGLAAGLPQSVPALTLDSQCCAGIDAVQMAMHLIGTGAAHLVVAGGVESYSMAPRRFARGAQGAPDQEYFRPPFAPTPEQDPDMLDAAAQLARARNISRTAQEEFAIHSHQKACGAGARVQDEIVTIAQMNHDPFTRQLSRKICAKLPVLTGDQHTGLTAATIAVEADGAGLCLLASKAMMQAHPDWQNRAVRVCAGLSRGSDPAMPPRAPIPAIQHILQQLDLRAADLSVVEMMEAFAVQAMVCVNDTELPFDRTNLGGGALARGHPIGASGAINLVRLFHELQLCEAGAYGLAAIAGAGGLGSAMVMQR